MRKILVIGATGQTGFATIQKLALRGVDIRALVRDPGQTSRFAVLGVDSVVGDLTDPASLRRACAGITTVVATANAAVPSRPSDSFKSVERDGYRNLIAAAAEAGVRRFVYTSATLSNYTHLSPLIQYKRATEEALAESCLDHVIFRAGVFMDVAFAMMGSAIPLRGSEMATIQRPFRFANRYFASIRDSIETKHLALIPGDGTTRHSFICIDDVASYLAAAAVQGPGGIHTIGGPEPLTFLDVVAIYERILGSPLRVRRTPPAVFRIAATVLRPFSPAAANLMALNYIATQEQTVFDTAPSAIFGVHLTRAEDFLRSRSAMGATG